MTQRAKQNTENQPVLQTYCLHATGGHLWMRDFFDTLPATVRQRLRSSPFNLCAWCLEIEVLPEVQRKRRGLSREKALFAAIEVMEAAVRQGKAP
jgi:hypothetical protein